MIATFWMMPMQSSKSIRIQNQLVRFMVDEGMQISMNSCESINFKTKNKMYFGISI
jgi:hypothetical protein